MLILYSIALVDHGLSGRARRPATRVLGAPLELRTGEPWELASLRRSLLVSQVPESTPGQTLSAAFAVEGTRLRVGPGVIEGVDTLILTPTTSGLLLADAGGRALDRASVRPVVIGPSAPGDVVRWPVPLAAMAPVLLTVVLDMEDRTFLSHSGLSLRGLARAAIHDLVHGGAVQGGSTITQHLAKILLLKPSRTVPRKVLEAWRQIEARVPPAWLEGEF